MKSYTITQESELYDILMKDIIIACYVRCNRLIMHVFCANVTFFVCVCGERDAGPQRQGRVLGCVACLMVCYLKALNVHVLTRIHYQQCISLSVCECVCMLVSN